MTALDTKEEMTARPAEPRVSPLRASVAGVLAAAVALAVTQLVSAMRDGPSLIDTVGTEFINRFAAPLKDLAVSLFGTNDKAALVTGIVIVALVAGALLGLAAARRPWVGPVGFGLFALVGIATGTTDPLASGPLMVAAAVTGCAAGIVTLEILLRQARMVTSAQPSRRRVEDPRITQASRRSFLAWSGGAAAVAVVAGGAARSLNSRHAPVGEGISLPPARSMAPLPATQPFDAAGLSDYITPNADFYRIDTALFVPRVNASTWKLSVQGMVDNPFEISYDELLSMPLVDEPVTIACVSNEVGGDLIGNAVWRGVPLASLLDRAGVQPGATQVVGVSVDEFTVGFPTETALDGRTALVAVGMNGEALPQRHGFPARLIVAGLYGYVSATKWLKDIVLTRLEDFDAYWVPRGWSKDAPIKTESRIDVPRTGASLTAGRVPVAGVAWAPTRGIRAVEVRVDEGAWEPARLGDVANDNTWVQWLFDWDASPGRHRLEVRATDGTGATQTSDESPPAPDGATGYHSRNVTIR